MDGKNKVDAQRKPFASGANSAAIFGNLVDPARSLNSHVPALADPEGSSDGDRFSLSW